MEEKDRYEVISPSLNGYAYIHDFKTDNVLNTYDSCDLLNQQSKRIKELEQENQQLKQQLEDTEESYNNTMRYLNKTRSELLNLPKKIVEEIRDVAGDYCEECGNVPDLNTLTMEDFDEILDTILEKFGGKDEINND